MSVHTLFSHKSELYESARPLYPEALFEYLSTVAPATEAVWDCACGNGQAADSLVRYFQNVAATDVSTAQIENAKQHPKIQYSVCSSENSVFDGGAFDLVCVAQALHWFDFDKFWPEVKRVLKPGGVFAAWGYTWPCVSSEIDQELKCSILDKIESYWAPQNRLLWDHYRDVEFPFTQLSPPSFEMKVDWTLDEYLDFICTFSATRLCIDEHGDEFIKQARKMLLELWGDGKKEVNLDFVLYVGKVQ